MPVLANQPNVGGRLREHCIGVVPVPPRRGHPIQPSARHAGRRGGLPAAVRGVPHRARSPPSECPTTTPNIPSRVLYRRLDRPCERPATARLLASLSNGRAPNRHAHVDPAAGVPGGRHNRAIASASWQALARRTLAVHRGSARNKHLPRPLRCDITTHGNRPDRPNTLPRGSSTARKRAIWRAGTPAALLEQASGLEQHLDRTVVFALEHGVGGGGRVEREPVGGEGVHAERVVVADEGSRSSTQRRTLAWPMRRCTCLSNKVSMGSGSVIPPYTPITEMVPPRRTTSMAVCRRLLGIRGQRRPLFRRVTA